MFSEKLQIAAREFIGNNISILGLRLSGVPEDMEKALQLAKGNAEIKELVSILRCASFGGFMTLAASNCHNGNIAKIAVEFRKLLDES
jgi:hypothetical protein